MNCRLLGLLIFGMCGVLVSMGGCGTAEEEPAAKNERGEASPWSERGLLPLQLDVDRTLLGFVYEDSSLGLRFAPPRGWPPLEPELFDQSRTILGQVVPRASRFHSHPVRIFYEKENNYFMIVAEFREWNTPADPFSAFADYRRRVEGVMGEVQVLDSAYALRDMAVYELLIHNPLMVNLRSILIRRGRLPVQVDFLVPRNAYPSLVKAIEASIGSFETLQ